MKDRGWGWVWGILWGPLLGGCQRARHGSGPTLLQGSGGCEGLSPGMSCGAG